MPWALCLSKPNLLRAQPTRKMFFYSVFFRQTVERFHFKCFICAAEAGRFRKGLQRFVLSFTSLTIKLLSCATEHKLILFSLCVHKLLEFWLTVPALGRGRGRGGFDRGGGGRGFGGGRGSKNSSWFHFHSGIKTFVFRWWFWWPGWAWQRTWRW